MKYRSSLKNLLPFLKESIRLQKLLTDGADFLLTVSEKKKSVKRKSIAKIAWSHWEKNDDTNPKRGKNLSTYAGSKELRFIRFTHPMISYQFASKKSIIDDADILNKIIKYRYSM